jgi:hypothetical protein
MYRRRSLARGSLTPALCAAGMSEVGQESREHDHLHRDIGIGIEEIREAQRDAAGGEMGIADQCPSRILGIARNDEGRLTRYARACGSAVHEEMTAEALGRGKQGGERARSLQGGKGIQGQ